jgi:methyl-accepting chemotaxis protein
MPEYSMTTNGALAAIRASVKNLNDDYTELAANYASIIREIACINATAAELRTEIRWLKTLMVPIAVASIVSAVKVLLG